MKSGSKKTKIKPDAHRRNIRKLYQWTPGEYSKLQQAVGTSGIKESKIVQTATMEKVDELIQRTANKAL